MTTPTKSPTLGSRLRAARLAKGWTVERLAAEASVSILGLCRIEASNKPVRDYHLVREAMWIRLGRIAVALNVSLANLFEEDEHAQGAG